MISVYKTKDEFLPTPTECLLHVSNVDVLIPLEAYSKFISHPLSKFGSDAHLSDFCHAFMSHIDSTRLLSRYQWQSYSGQKRLWKKRWQG